MIANPRYSFVRFNDDGYSVAPCVTGETKCLPLYDLSDLKFQVITAFADEGEAISKIIAVPCSACGETSDADILEMAFGVDTRETTGSSDNGGFLKITTGVPFSGIIVGDYVHLTEACTAGCAHDYAGAHRVLEIVGSQLTLDTVYQGNIDTMSVTVTLLSGAAFLLSELSTALDYDAELTGINYLWDVASPAWASSLLDYNDGDCFSLCLYRATKVGEFTDVECIGSTNCFYKTSDLCYTSKLVYGCNEDTFGFYTDGSNPFEVSVRLPFFLNGAQFPGEEKGYQKSDGTYLKLAERINKTWELETDLLPDEWHERLRVALSCDNIEVSNEGVNLTDEPVYRSEGYTIDEPVESFKLYPFRKAKTKLFKKQLVASVNSNCV